MRRLAMRRLSSESAVQRRVRRMNDFVCTWEIERRMRPFGSRQWEEVTEDMMDRWEAAYAKKADLLTQVANDLGDVGGAPPPLSKGQVHALAAEVASDGSFNPEAPRAVPGNRMFRVYGPHRFLRVRYQDPLPKHQRLHVLTYAGRRWELLYADLGGRAIIYFAVSGSGLRPLPISRLRDWHIPLDENQDMTLAKYNARFALAFSDSIPTVAFDQVAPVVDYLSPEGVVMNDGCAAMPLWAMQQIASAAELSHLPAAVQGRIGAAKGVWFLDPQVNVPQITASQSKAKIPHPTLEQRRFELVEWARDRGPASLNYQFIYVLMHLGVPEESFISLLREHAAHLKSDLLSRTHHFLSNIAPSDALAWPLLAAGFDPENLPYLRRVLSGSASTHLMQLADRVRIPVKQSRWMLMVADPTHTLEMGQAYAWPSSRRAPIRGQAIAARNPCHLPSDIQQMELVDVPALAHLRDVLVVPTKGPYPWASLLSGGDYDGDLAFVSWEPRLIPPPGCLERMPPPTLPTSKHSPSPADTRSLRELLPAKEEDQHGVISLAIVDLFRNFSPNLGILTHMHAYWAEKSGVKSANAERLGWLCREAVDAPKSGAKVRIPKALGSERLSRTEVLPFLRGECQELAKNFLASWEEDKDDARNQKDADLVLEFTTREQAAAQAEYRLWRKKAREAFENKGDIETVKRHFHSRFLAMVEKNPSRRLFLASAYYVAGASSASNSFAFSCCFRELIRIKADAVEHRQSRKNQIAFSVPSSKR